LKSAVAGNGLSFLFRTLQAQAAGIEPAMLGGSGLVSLYRGGELKEGAADSGTVR
jgi:hypothetical protein